MTEVIKINNEKDFPLLVPAALALKNGALCAIPTETVYGLGANAFLPDAVKNIFSVKGRPQDNPLIVHIDSLDMLKRVAEFIPANAKKVMEAFWPGPLTIIMKKHKDLPSEVTAGLDTVAVRMPSHFVARQFIKESGVPVVAPSANTSGRPSPTTCAHVLDDLNGKIPYIIDGGASTIGLESTVLDLTGDIPQILRPGGISLEELKAVLGNVVYDDGIIKDGVAPKSPGMKYKHYAPKAQMYIVEGENSYEQICSLIKKHKTDGVKIGVLAMDENKYDADFVINITKNPAEYASLLFDTLRKFDSLGADIIFAQTFSSSDGIKAAIKNRIYKAAGGKVILC